MEATPIHANTAILFRVFPSFRIKLGNKGGPGTPRERVLPGRAQRAGGRRRMSTSPRLKRPSGVTSCGLRPPGQRSSPVHPKQGIPRTSPRHEGKRRANVGACVQHFSLGPRFHAGPSRPSARRSPGGHGVPAGHLGIARRRIAAFSPSRKSVPWEWLNLEVVDACHPSASVSSVRSVRNSAACLPPALRTAIPPAAHG